VADERKRKFWGWGFETRAKRQQQKHIGGADAKRFDLGALEILPRRKRANLICARASQAANLAQGDLHEQHARARESFVRQRLSHIVRAYRREYPNPFDVDRVPRDENELVPCSMVRRRESARTYAAARACRRVERRPAEPQRCGVDRLKHLDKVLEAIRFPRRKIQRGCTARARCAMKPNGYTIRHFPQSFEFSTLGGGSRRDGRAFRDAIHAYR